MALVRFPVEIDGIFCDALRAAGAVVGLMDVPFARAKNDSGFEVLTRRSEESDL